MNYKLYNELVTICNEFEQTLDVKLFDKMNKLQQYDDGYCIYATFGNVWDKLCQNIKNKATELFGVSFDNI